MEFLKVFLIKINSSNGDILWKTVDNSSYTINNNFQRNAVLSNGDILFFPYYYYENDPNYDIKKLNSSNGQISTVPINGYISTNQTQAFEVDNNDNIYISSQLSNQNQTSSLVKYDSNLNLLWSINVSDNSGNGNDARVSDIEYDEINNLLYVIGSAKNTDINPLGSSVVTTNNANSGTYFAAYNTSGILQLSHGFETDINASFSHHGDRTLEVFNNKLVFRSYFSGYVDFDITDGVFYTVLIAVGFCLSMI